MSVPKSYMEYKLLMNAASYYDEVEGIVLPAVVSLSGVSMHTWPLRGIRIFPTMLPYWDEEGVQAGGYTAGACGIGHMHLRDVVHRAKILSAFAGLNVNLYDGIDTSLCVTNVTGQHHQYKDGYEWEDNEGKTGNIVCSYGWEPYFKDDFVFARGNDIERHDGALYMAPFWPDYKDQPVYVDFYKWTDDLSWPLVRYSENPDLGSTVMMTATLITYYDPDESDPIVPNIKNPGGPYQFYGWHNDFMLDNYMDGIPAIDMGGNGSGAFPEENSMGIIRAPISNETHHGWTISSIMPQGSSWGDINPDYPETLSHDGGIEAEGTKLWRSEAGRTAIIMGTDRVWIDCKTTEDGAEHCYHRGNQMVVKENDFGLIGLPPNMPPDAAFYHMKSFTDGVINIEGSPYGSKQLLHTNLIFFGEFVSDRPWHTVVDNDVDPDTGDAWIDIGVNPAAYGIPGNCTFCLTTTSKAIQVIELADESDNYRQQAWGLSMEKYAFGDDIKELQNAYLAGYTDMEAAYRAGVLSRMPAVRTAMINDLQLAWQPITVGITPHVSHMRPEYNHEVFDPETQTYRNEDVASWVIYKNPKFVSGSAVPYEILEHYIKEPGGQISLGKTGWDRTSAFNATLTYIGDVPRGGDDELIPYFITYPTISPSSPAYYWIESLSEMRQLTKVTPSLGHPALKEYTIIPVYGVGDGIAFSTYYYNSSFTIQYYRSYPGPIKGELITETINASQVNPGHNLCYGTTTYDVYGSMVSVKLGTTSFSLSSFVTPEPDLTHYSVLSGKGLTFNYQQSSPGINSIYIRDIAVQNYEIGHAARRMILPVSNPRAMGLSHLSAPVVAIPDLRAHWQNTDDIDFETAFDRDVEICYFATALTMGEMDSKTIWDTELSEIGSIPSSSIKNFETHRLEVAGQLPMQVDDINGIIYIVVKFQDDDVPVDNSEQIPTRSESNDIDKNNMSYSNAIRMYAYNNDTISSTADQYRAYGYLTAFVTCADGVSDPGAVVDVGTYDISEKYFLDPRPV